MNEEQKEALEILKGLEFEEYDWYVKTDKIEGHANDVVEKVEKALQTILHLIDKQQKEIDELNKSDASKEQSSMDYYNLYKELEDKIKEIITEFIPKSNHEVVLRAKLIKLLGE